MAVVRLKSWALVPLLVFVWTEGRAQTAKVGCPPTLVTEQRVPETPKGYLAQEDAFGPSDLAYVTISDGPPDQHADLVPDRQSGTMATWDLRPSSTTTGGFYLSCHYARTRYILSQPIPVAIKRCTVRYQKASEGLLEGYRTIEEIVCGT